MERTIIHCDMNSFYASVELLSRPDLKDCPVAVSGSPESRHGIILAKNEAAKKCGVVTAETIWSAQKKCPNLQLLRPHHDKYKKYSKLINEIYYNYTDMVEPFSIDESWLDVTGSLKLFGTGAEIANKIREDVKSQLGLTLSAGVSYNKIFAKMGSDYKKPDATTIISKDNFKDILWPMNISDMFFVGHSTENKLKKLGIITIGDLANTDKSVLIGLLGKHGGLLYDYSNGLDNSPVLKSYERQRIKSVGNGITFRRNLITSEDIQTALKALSDNVSTRLRGYQLKACGVKIDIKDPYFKTISRQKQLISASNITEEIYNVSFEILSSCWTIGNPIRLLTVTGINLIDENSEEQLNFFSNEHSDRKKNSDLDKTIDAIRNKYGGNSIFFGGIINNDLGIDLLEEENEE
ncbi:MAG: DNA polymerase IV [Aminipila sp.]